MTVKIKYLIVPAILGDGSLQYTIVSSTILPCIEEQMAGPSCPNSVNRFKITVASACIFSDIKNQNYPDTNHADYYVLLLVNPS